MGETDEQSEDQKTIVLAQKEPQDQRFLTAILHSVGGFEVVGAMSASGVIRGLHHGPELILVDPPVRGNFLRGVALMRPDGVPLMANAAIGRLLGLELLDGAGFAARTGCDPALVCEGEAATTFSLEDDGLVIQVPPCDFEGEPVALVVVQAQRLPREITRAPVQIQEELVGELRGGGAEPLQVFRNFLENPDAAGLGTARAAFEQIEMFLQAFLLTSPPEDQ